MDATASGLSQQPCIFTFPGAVCLLQDVLTIVAHFGKTFQEGEICLASIAPAIVYILHNISDVSHQRKHSQRLKVDLSENSTLQR